MTTIEIIWMAFATIMAIGACIFAWLWRMAEKDARFWRGAYFASKKNIDALNTGSKENNSFFRVVFMNQDRDRLDTEWVPKDEAEAILKGTFLSVSEESKPLHVYDFDEEDLSFRIIYNVTYGKIERRFVDFDSLRPTNSAKE